MKSQTNRNSQSGAAIILFAMVMMIVLSLIAVGFAFLVRNDQRQTLDKTLSNQATYAAESAINRKAKQLKDGTETTPAKTDCSGTPADFFGAAFADVQITCLNWDAQPEVLSISNIDESPKSVKVKPLVGNVTYFAIRWQKPATCTAASVWEQKLNTLDAANACPILKISMSDANSVYQGTGKGSLVYSRPQNDAAAYPPNGNTYSMAEQTAGSIYGNQVYPNPSGEIDNSWCANGYCMIRVPVIGVWNSANTGLIAFSTLGGSLNLEISAYTDPFTAAGNGAFFDAARTPILKTTNRVKLIEAQAIIDATAKANDVIKRVRVSVPIAPDTWTPGFAINANSICKNYRTNAIGNTVNGPADAAVCY